MIGAGRPKVRKKINWAYADDMDREMFVYGMDLSGSWLEPVAGVVNTIKCLISSVYTNCGKFIDFINNHKLVRDSVYELDLFQSATSTLN
jgi:hypothetical protein